MSGLLRRGSALMVGGLLLAAAVACSSDTTTTTNTTAGGSTSVSTTAAPGTTEASGGSATTEPESPGTSAKTSTTESGDTTDPSVPVVDAASVEAFCALDKQLDDISDTQMADVNTGDPDGIRLALAKFFTDNAAIIDQYVAAAPPEIADDVEATIEQTRAAVNDPALFSELMSGQSEVSDRVSAFTDANCTN